MPRKDFQTHLKDAQDAALPANVSSLHPGQDDGTFTVVYELTDSHEIRIQAQASDVGDYPRSHSFFIYTDSNDVPRTVSSALQDISILSEMTISQAIREIVGKLDYATAKERPDENEDVEMEEDFSDPADLEDEFCPLDDEDLHDEGYETFGSPKISISSRRPSTHSTDTSREEQAKLARQLREDLDIVKKAGFRVSHHGAILSPGQQCYLMISIRVAKLDIPDDTLQAWHLHRADYIMLTLKYQRGYRQFDELRNSAYAQRYLTMYLLVTKKHKLSLNELSNAIDSTKKVNNESEIAEQMNDTDQVTRPLFIGPALNELLNTRLLTLISYRLGGSFTWAGAIQYYNDQQGTLTNSAQDQLLYQSIKDISKTKNLPRFIESDHVQDVISKSYGKLSIPCAAMQFALRHIVRCTEFCLVCFANTQDEFEALKPYVCSKPLCLYQYMSMGLGPGIEFEVLSQKYVVDLLVSFCYSGAVNYGLRELPLGLGIMVPDPNLLPGLPQVSSDQYSTATPQSTGTWNAPTNPYASQLLPPSQNLPSRKVVVQGKWIEKVSELILPDKYNIEHDPTLPEKVFHVGDWMAFWTDGKLYHCKITEVFHPVYRYQNLIQSRSGALNGNGKLNIQFTFKRKEDESTSSLEAGALKVQIAPYGRLFDTLGLHAKQTALRAMLDTLPSVAEMAVYLRTARGSSSQLIKWTEQIIPAALAIFRWIIASNRSCLVYTGDNPDQELIQGMPGFLQFRFASGAPDKEFRFLKNVREKQSSLKQAHPTIFAWHGSPLKNWHSIIREGLDFKETAHGRAYGHGVYHALHASVSIGYAPTLGKASQWPASMLDVQQALSLNEIVNAPAEFQSARPYLVVQHLEWIQTRYLFVKCGKKDIFDATLHDKPPLTILPQDSSYTPVDTTDKALVIPSGAISKSRQSSMTLKFVSSSGSKRKPKVGCDVDHPIYVSDESDSEDAILYQTSPDTLRDAVFLEESSGKARELQNLLDFNPGALDRSRLPMLDPPTYATTASSKALQREIKNMLKEQKETPLHELGWYLDPEHIENPYQWIVELHSFENTLPLAKDMKSRNVNSIVVEIRFGPNFNFSPPFVRVVRPRFLPFQQGGGGHVTAGGALCMQLLTSDGWNPSSTMSAVLLQVRMAMTSLDPTPARLERSTTKSEYGVGEAIEAYRRACIGHGWKIPDDFQKMTTMKLAAPKVGEMFAENGQRRSQIDLSNIYTLEDSHKKQRRL